MVLHLEFKRSTRQFWRQMEMFRVFTLQPELEVCVSYNDDPVDRILLHSEYCSVEIPQKSFVTFRASVIDALPLHEVEALIRRFAFKTCEQSHIATLGMLL